MPRKATIVPQQQQQQQPPQQHNFRRRCQTPAASVAVGTRQELVVGVAAGDGSSDANNSGNGNDNDGSGGQNNNAADEDCAPAAAAASSSSTTRSRRWTTIGRGGGKKTSLASRMLHGGGFFLCVLWSAAMALLIAPWHLLDINPFDDVDVPSASSRRTPASELRRMRRSTNANSRPEVGRRRRRNGDGGDGQHLATLLLSSARHGRRRNSVVDSGHDRSSVQRPASPIVGFDVGRAENSSKTPDYGDFVHGYRAVANFTVGRVIDDDDDMAEYGRMRRQMLAELDGDVDSDDVDREDPHRYDPFDELTYDGEDRCYPLKWRYSVAKYSTCNEVHAAVSIERPPDPDGGGAAGEQAYDVSYISHGAYRNTHMLADARQPGQGDAVLKMLRKSVAFKNYAFSQVRNEVLCMLRTQSSKRTMNVYQYCGSSIVVEPGDEIEEAIIPRYGWNYVDQEEVDRRRERLGTLAMNGLSPARKLELATIMTESIAELHGHREGAIVSHDISFEQWLRSKKDGQIKLNDLNKAHVLDWNPAQNRSCKFYSHQYSSYRGPEEINGGYIDESSDVNSLGKFFYTIVTGLRVYYERGEKKKAIKAALGGELPYVDPRFRESSFIEGRLVDIMERMWVYNASERVDIFTVLSHLRETARLAGDLKNRTTSDS